MSPVSPSRTVRTGGTVGVVGAATVVGIVVASVVVAIEVVVGTPVEVAWGSVAGDAIGGGGGAPAAVDGSAGVEVHPVRPTASATAAIAR